MNRQHLTVGMLLATILGVSGCVQHTPSSQVDTDKGVEGPHIDQLPKLRLDGCESVTPFAYTMEGSGVAKPESWPQPEPPHVYMLEYLYCSKIAFLGFERNNQSLLIESILPDSVPETCPSYLQEKFLVQRLQQAWISDSELAASLTKHYEIPFKELEAHPTNFPVGGFGTFDLNIVGDDISASWTLSMNQYFNENDVFDSAYAIETRNGISILNQTATVRHNDLNQNPILGNWPDRPWSPGQTLPGQASLAYGSITFSFDPLEEGQCDG